ncbi:MAG TPA: ABC transporter ATP-binding protein, partial [Thermoanaerobaculia bacterium]|nr:ABC transporter ATP-binding protein [Thermoanaerobaculia bacterium]
MTAFLSLDRLDKSFGVQTVLRGLSLEVAKGEIVALLGPSGSGKTTALRLIAGFETPDRGQICVEGVDVTAQPPERRHFGMVFQHYALFPHLTIGENVAFGLAGRGDRADVSRRVAAALNLVELPGYEGRRVGEISGGQQQRVALARALAPEPRVLLLDEPLSNLDPTLRERTRRELKRSIQRVGITTVLVTHEQEEAFYLGDRVAVLHGGVLHQVGTPEDLYEHPATRFVATFVGRASVLPSVLEGDGAVWVPVPAPEGMAPVRWTATRSPELAGAPPGEEVDVIVRPESLAFAAQS